MKGKVKRAKILLPKRIIRESSTPPLPATPNQIPVKANANRNKLIFSSTLQEGPVIPPNEIRLVFESEFSTIREESGNISEREIPTIDDVESSEESDTLVEVETPKRGENQELPKSKPGTNQVSVICKLFQDHKSGCDICSNSNSKADGSNQSPDDKDGGMKEQEPFCSFFKEDISRVPQKMEFQSENSFSIIAGPSNKHHHMRPSTSSNAKRNVLSTLQDGDETNNLFGRGPPAEELIKMDDSASQHEFRYYNGIRQRYCSSFKGNGFNVPDRIGFSCEESESTILNPSDHRETNESSESDEHTLQSESEAVEESVFLSADESVLMPPLKLRKTDKEPFCSTFRDSITTEPSHMSFNQNKGGPTLRPRKIPVSIVEETQENSTLNCSGDEKDTDYSASDSTQSSDENAELGIQKCVWMEAHILGCVHCNLVNTVKAVSRDYQKRTKNQRTAGHICPTCNKNFGQKGHLKRHVLTVHEKKKPYACNKCEKSFGEKTNLDTHILTVHEKKKPHACSKCDQSFGQKHVLDTHILTVHEKKKPHACSKCDQSFGQKQNLVVHLRIHDGEKPFTCPECKDSFTRKDHLTKHMRIHSKDKPFQCTTCNRKFNQTSNLRRHEKTQHPENVSETDSE